MMPLSTKKNKYVSPGPKNVRFTKIKLYFFQKLFHVNKIFYNKSEKLSPKKKQQQNHHQTTYQIISDESHKHKLGSSNIIADSFANATSNDDIFTTIEEEFVSDDMKPSTLMNHAANIEVISSTPIAAPPSSRKQDEFDIFGNLVAEIMRNMSKPKSRILQTNIMKLIADVESES